MSSPDLFAAKRLVPRVRGDDVAPFLRDVLLGLSQPQRQIPSKYFYDRRGSQLFERICGLDEYYLTRTELAIALQYRLEMVERIGAGAMLVEYGSGSSLKTRLLLEELRAPAAYVPIDISGEHLGHTALDLLARFPDLEVLPICADFTGPLELPRSRRAVRRRVVYFPGSTIGNFSPLESARLLRGIARLAGPGGGLLIGIDLKKDDAVLVPAYSDALGITRQFNFNLLARCNRELGANFHLDRFEHLALYNAERGRMESHLVSLVRQTVTIGPMAFAFEQGETIHTENSYKYDIAEFTSLAGTAGLKQAATWQDDRQLFAVLYFEVRSER